MIGSSRSYAIGMAHFQLAGGFKTLLTVCGVYLLLFGFGMAMYYFSNASFHLTPVIISLLIICEAFTLVVLGSFRVATAIRIDVSNKMIESHRLMPIPAWRAVVGYIFGGTTHAILFALLNVVLAFIFAGVTSTSITQVALNQALLFSFAILVWTLTATGTFISAQAVAILFVGGFFLSTAYIVLPGFTVLVSPMMGNTVFTFSGSNILSPWAYPATWGFQLAFIAILFTGSCRRYRGTLGTTFSEPLSVLLVVTWCACSFAGLALWDGLGHRSHETDFRRVQVGASIIASLILALAPLATFSAKRSSLLSWCIALVVLIASITLMPLGAGFTSSRFLSSPSEPVELGLQRMLVIGSIVATFILMATFALELLRRLKPWLKWLFITVGLLLYWLGPLMLQFIIAIMSDDREGRMGILGTLSPFGLLINTWSTNSNPPSPLVAIIVQWLITAALGANVLVRWSGAPARTLEPLPVEPPIKLQPAPLSESPRP